MLGKLLKYEFKGNARILIPFYGLILALSVINRLFSGTRVYDSEIGLIAMNISAFAYGLTFMAIMLLTAFLVIQRFAKTVYSDEGYLTHTLPVKSSDIIISKTISALLWVGLSGLVAMLSVFIIAYEPNIFRIIQNTYSLIIRLLGDGLSMVMFRALTYFMLISIAGSVSGILMVYMSISIGQLFSKKLLGSIGAFLGVSVVVNIVAGFVSNLYANINIQYFSFAGIAQYIDQIGIFILLFNVVLIGVFYYITNYIMKNKLNLE